MRYFRVSHWSASAFMVEATSPVGAAYIARMWLGMVNPQRGCGISGDALIISGPVSKVPDSYKVVKMIKGRPFGFKSSNNYRR